MININVHDTVCCVYNEYIVYVQCELLIMLRIGGSGSKAWGVQWRRTRCDGELDSLQHHMLYKSDDYLGVGIKQASQQFSTQSAILKVQGAIKKWRLESGRDRNA